jgi:hypothetical protein
MTTWTDQELTRVGAAEELRVSSYRPDGTLRPFVTTWTVRADDGIYICSSYGRDNGWFRGALASGTGRIRPGSVERDVRFEEPENDVHAAIDAAYHVTYDRYGPAIVGSVTGPDTIGETFRLIPQDEHHAR